MPRKLGIIAGKGELPALILDACRAEGRPVFVLGLEGQTAPDLPGNADGHAWVSLGAVGHAIDALHGAGIEDVVFAGAVKRPSIMNLRLDGRGAKLLTRAGAKVLGDDSLLSVLVDELESEGFRVVGADDVLDGLLAEEGVWGRHAPDETAERDIARGLQVAQAVGAVDVGQAVVVQQGMVLGIEAAEGTNALISRAAGLRREGPGGVLVKIKKPGQERRVDLPTIGASTVRGCAEAGLRGVAVEAGATLVLGRAQVVEAADSAGLFLIGVRTAP